MLPKGIRKQKISGVITEITRQKRKDNFCTSLGCLRVEIVTPKNKTEVFFTKLRKGLKLRREQRITFYRLKNFHASAWRHDLNVVGIDINGESVYRWQEKEGLVTYDGSGCS